MSSNFEVRHVKVLTASELDAAVKLCLRAYAGEAASDTMVGGDETLKDALFRCMIRAAEVAGETYIVTDTTGKLVAIAVWFPPGQTLFATPEQRALGFDDFSSKLSAETRDYWNNNYGPNVAEFLAGLLGPTGLDDSWYLNLIATDPDFQRRGIATTLLNTVVETLAGTNATIALCAANETNAAIYESRGFIRQGETVVVAPTGQFTIICLSRES